MSSRESEINAIKGEVQRRLRLLTKFEGCLVGGAAGDALGYPVEFMFDAEIRRKYGPSGISGYDCSQKTGLALVSDDTQMTLFTANGLLIGDTRGRLRGVGGPYASYCEYTYRDWFYTQDHGFEGVADVSWLLTVAELHSRRAPGNTCTSAIRSGMGSADRPPNGSKGCGGVMRVAPVGLYWANFREMHGEDLLDFVVSEGAQCAALTHGHPLGYICAGAMAYIVCRCASEVPPGCFERRERLRSIVLDCADSLARWFPDHPHAAAYQAKLLRLALDLASNPRWSCKNIAELGEGWVGEEALAIGVYACMRHPDSFSDAIRVAASHGGDSDSTASIAGQVMGAMMGMEGIDSCWTDRLELRDVILEVAHDLCVGCQMSEYGDYYDEAWMAKYGGSCEDSLAINDHLRGNERQSDCLDDADAPEGDPFSLARFKDAQDYVYLQALKEVSAGKKRSHWMWYVFPQLSDLGYSRNAKYYGISGLAEAYAYMKDPLLADRLVRIVNAAMESGESDAHELFGSPDDMKFRSCLTLFEAAAPKERVFTQALDAFFGDVRCPYTQGILAKGD